jgi:hypothetical protein
LAQVSAANTDSLIKVKVEQFQNRFYIQRQAVEKLLKQIKSHENHLADIAKQNEVASDHFRFTDHTTMRQEVQSAFDIQSTLKQEFNRFIADHY